MSKVQGGMKCVKYLLFVFNFIFWLSGSVVLAVGVWLRCDPDTDLLLAGAGAPDSFFIAVYILICAGGLMMVVGFFGCFGAVRESQCLLASVITSFCKNLCKHHSFPFVVGKFFACLLIIFGAEVAAGVFGFLNQEQIVEEVQKFYSTSVAETADPNYNGTTVASIYHSVLHCCGGATPDPALCPATEEETKDCLTAITDFFNEKLYIIGFVGIGVAGVMVLGMIFSMVLCCAIRNSREII